MSELHKRLAHLVNYSSQLIFVSGDTIADQQRTLNDFLSSQQDNTEISFFSAASSKQASDYRGAICRQLGGHEVGSFVRPLQQLLSDPVDGLSSDAGPYLVCITKAELLTTAFLQELWDWVMQSEQASPGIHLNVILFGESAWAKKSQEWLPIQNSHRPVLLSSQSVNPVGFDVNALEALMADKSSWFSTSNEPLVTNRWFIGSVLLVFFVIFVSLMAWQYPSQFSSLITGKPPLSGLSENEEPINISIEKMPREAIVDEEFSVISTEKPLYQAQLEFIQAAVAVEAPDALTDSLLVGSWSSITNSPELPIVDPNSLNNPTPSEAVVQASTPNEAPESAQAINNSDGDFKVPDIISVEQLNAQFSRQQLTSETLTLANIREIPQKSEVIASQSTSTIDYQFDETTLLSLPSDAVVLQLSGIQNPVVLQNYLNRNNLKGSTWVYETQRYGGPWYVVLYRQSFESIDAALEQLSSLPADVREAQPFAKSINQIQQEISRR